MEEGNHPSYVTTYHSMGGPKAVLMCWNEEGFYEPWNTGPGMKTPKLAEIYARDWAKAEGIEFR